MLKYRGVCHYSAISLLVEYCFADIQLVEQYLEELVMEKMSYKIKIAGLERELPLCELNDDLYIAAFVIFGDPELTVSAADALLEKAPEYDYLITAESKGIPLIHEMARQHGDKKYFLARKSPKLYMTGVFCVDVDSITTAGTQKLYLDILDADMIRGKRILIVDDVISTGNSLTAMERLIEAAGGVTAGKMALLAEGDAIGRKDIIYLEKLPLFEPDGTPIW
jgi:adenine phosphoribosyltransferase